MVGTSMIMQQTKGSHNLASRHRQKNKQLMYGQNHSSWTHSAIDGSLFNLLSHQKRCLNNGLKELLVIGYNITHPFQGCRADSQVLQVN